jgi:ribonuclease HIII
MEEVSIKELNNLVREQNIIKTSEKFLSNQERWALSTAITSVITSIAIIDLIKELRNDQ